MPERSTQPLMDGWRFVLDHDMTDQEALADPGGDWEKVTLPHTWNAIDAASDDLPGSYERGRGWYRLELDTPDTGERHWLEIGAASLVADVWLNGAHLGQHKGGFTAFRFDVTDHLLPDAVNVLLVKVDNSEPQENDDLTAIAPLGGDFNVSGGLYRHVALISTGATHFDLADLGGPGVYATTSSVDGTTAVVHVRARVTNDGDAAGDVVARFALLDDTGRVAASAEQPITLEPANALEPSETVSEVEADLRVSDVRLWRGVEDPYLYTLRAELVDRTGRVMDGLEQSFGIRQMQFDPERGFFLNGQALDLRGVAMHQDFLHKGWAISEDDMDATLELVREVGANAVRLGHYPFSHYALQRVSELGLVAWAETAVGLRTVVEGCTVDPNTGFVDNVQQQLRELIRQQFNHAAIAIWAVGNETEALAQFCGDGYDNVTPVIRLLHAVALEEDPSRVTAYAEFSENVDGPGPFPVGGTTDLLATNRYYWWYDLAVEEFPAILETLRARYEAQPLGISEYGAGGAVTHHTDDPTGGVPDVTSAPDGEVSYQPEEYAAHVHELDWRQISQTPYLWGSFVWNMFDFGSAYRNEGDVLGVNTKGLVTFDRLTRKDAFYFYKANWSVEPVTHIVGRRYTDRAYPVADVKVYSNADAVELEVNGSVLGRMTADQCPQMTCLFPEVHLGVGQNFVAALGDHAETRATDEVQWSVESSDINIAAGRLWSGYVSTSGTRFGSDAFFSGGTPSWIEAGNAQGGTPAVANTPDPLLYTYVRRGEFSYDIPLAAGTYDVTLGFVEPETDMPAGGRVFHVSANSEPVLTAFDVVAAAGAPWTVVTRTFTVDVEADRLLLDFVPGPGEAIVSIIEIVPQP